MRLKEFSTNISSTPQKQRLDNLKLQKDNASKALKAERDRQKVAKARQTIATTKINQSTL